MLAKPCWCSLLSVHQKVPSLSGGLAISVADWPQIADPQPPLKEDQWLWQTAAPAVLSGRNDRKFRLCCWHPERHGRGPFLPAEADEVCAIMTAESLRHWDEEGTSSGSKGGPSKAKCCKEVSTNSRFFLAGTKGRAVETAVSISTSRSYRQHHPPFASSF